MLSHLYRIAAEFEHRHGVMPNLLYLNHAHFEQLEQALSGLRDSAALLRNLDMAVVLQQDVVHPRVAWSAVRARAVSGQGRAGDGGPSIHNGVGRGQSWLDPL
ncbi:MAG: hypothetical protein JSU62_10655 [Gammaproteobacteria bacterium]|nr:MAG: hypothetical protein JSU62_10655 [Gammaproteobacteria bacterium]